LKHTLAALASLACAAPVLAADAPQVPYPDGSVIVFDLLEAPAADSAITEGARSTTMCSVLPAIEDVT